MRQDSYDQTLNAVRKIYSFWGRFPFLYCAQDVITFFGRAKAIRSMAVEELCLKYGDSVLEVACGSGRNFPYLVKAVGGNGRILGFDYSQEMLDAAKRLCEQNGWDTVRLMRGDAAQLAIAENHVDGVLSVLGISAIPGWEKAIERCSNVLRPGGRLVVCDARLFEGFLKIFNPFISFVYSRLAAWDPSKNIPKKMKETFGNVAVRDFNCKTFFIAMSVKDY